MPRLPLGRPPFRLVLALVLLAAALPATTVALAPPAHAGAAPGCDGSVEAPATRFVVDDCGRVIVMRGVNVENQSKGWGVPVSPLELQESLGRWGWNSVRFLLQWSAIEPEPGVYDEGILDQVEVWLDWYAEHGVHVTLDMHQDLYGIGAGGNGAPAWAVITDGLVFEGREGPWWLSAVDPATQAAYQNFWDPARGHPELQDHYFDMWRHVAERFGEHPAVIGYDLMNEPVFANGDIDATLAVIGDAAAGRFDNHRLTDFMQRGIDTIREVDQDNWVGIEPTSLINAFPFAGDLLEDELGDPRPGPARLIYAPHLYEPNVHEGTGYPAGSTYVSDWEGFRTDEADRMQASLWFGEWGFDSDQDRASQYRNRVLAMSDRAMAGWAWWEWGPSGDDGGWAPIRGDGRLTRSGRALRRVQPSAVAGTPTRFWWLPQPRTFQLEWDERASVLAPTTVAVPAALYPDGFQIHLDGEVLTPVGGPGDPAGAGSLAEDDPPYRWDPDRSQLEIEPDRASADHLLCIAPVDVTVECSRSTPYPGEDEVAPPSAEPPPPSATGGRGPVVATPAFTG